LETRLPARLLIGFCVFNAAVFGFPLKASF